MRIWSWCSPPSARISKNCNSISRARSASPEGSESDVKKRNQKSKKQNNRKPAPRPRASEANEMLSEFSDDYNDFYVDEVSEKRVKEREERDARRDAARAARRKPASPMRRKLIRILSTIAIVAVILIVGIVLSLTVLFKTQSYEVIGNTLYPEEDIISTCGISKGENIFLAAKGPAEDRIVERFPYIESARVSFSLPDTIRIEVVQARESYLFKVSDTEYLIVSSRGCVLNRTTAPPDYLPVFIGPKLTSGEVGKDVVYEDDTVMEIIKSITRVFDDYGYQGITEIDATDTAAITFTYDGRIKVKLGIPEDLSYKIRTAMTIITGNIDVNPASRQQGILDVSRCNVTKRSYFKEGDIRPTEPTTAEPTTVAPTQKPTETGDSGEGGDWTDDDWSDDDAWSDDDTWSDDDWSDGDYDWQEGDWN